MLNDQIEALLGKINILEQIKGEQTQNEELSIIKKELEERTRNEEKFREQCEFLKQ